MRTLIFLVGLMVGSQILAANGYNGVNPQKQTIHNWLSNHATYPSAAEEQRQEGVVYVSFLISETGTIENVKVEQGVCQNLDEAAIALVQNMPVQDLLAGSQEGESFYVVPIKFVIR